MQFTSPHPAPDWPRASDDLALQRAPSRAPRPAASPSPPRALVLRPVNHECRHDGLRSAFGRPSRIIVVDIGTLLSESERRVRPV